MGSFDGPPYLSKFATTEQEMYEGTLGLSSAGKIDNIDNLKNDQVYIFQGLLDSVVPWGIVKLESNHRIVSNLYFLVLEEGLRMWNLYQKFVSSENIELKDDLEAEHGFVTKSLI